MDDKVDLFTILLFLSQVIISIKAKLNLLWQRQEDWAVTDLILVDIHHFLLFLFSDFGKG